jgi:uncharacterized protein
VKELVLRIIKGLADQPDQARVDESEQSGSLHLRLTLAEGDKGKIIGKQGKVIKAIRAVVGAAAANAGKKAVVEID